MNNDLDEDTIERLNEAFTRVTYHREPVQLAQGATSRDHAVA